MTRFDQDLFISYAHIDNQSLSAEQDGWISRFHLSLAAMLSMRLGKKVRIWRDDKLQGNDVFAEEIVEQFGRTAVLVSVLTPRYLKSRWCTREVSEFCALAESSGGVIVDNKARVFKVLKTPVDSEDPLPPLLQSLLGYEFFTMDDGAPLELDALYGESFAQDYHRKVNKLAFEIAGLLTMLEEAGEPPLAPAASDEERVADADPARRAVRSSVGPLVSSAGPGGRCVYLADCSFDRKEEREILQAELSRLGHQVLPDRHLPRDEEECVAAIAAALERADLAVHLIGAHAGAVADGPSGKPLVVLQNELAAARSERAGLKRVIWLPQGTVTSEPGQQAFLRALHDQAQAQCGADLLTGGLESLREAVFAALEDAGPSPQAGAGASASTGPSTDAADDEASVASGASGSALPDGETSERRSMHLLCTKADRKATVPLRRALKARGIDVTLPAFEGPATEVREANRQLLMHCEAVVLYYGHGDEAWKRTVDTELLKLPAYRSGADIPTVHTYLAAPTTPDKEDLVDMDEPNLVDALDGFDEHLVDAVLSVESAESSAA